MDSIIYDDGNTNTTLALAQFKAFLNDTYDFRNSTNMKKWNEI